MGAKTNWGRTKKNKHRVLKLEFASNGNNAISATVDVFI